MRKRLGSERTWVLFFAIFLALVTAFPYLVAASQSGAEFTGFLIGVEDGNSYIAKMLAGAQGDWLFRSPYSAMEQGGALIYLPYVLLGRLLGPGVQHATLVLIFHIFRVFSVIIICFAVYDFVAFFIRDLKLRRLGLALVTLGSGLGWALLFVGISSLAGSIPLDFYSPETFGFLAIFSLPHLVLARAFLLWGLLAYLRAGDRAELPSGEIAHGSVWWTSFLWLAMALSHLITAALGLALIAAHFAYLLVRNHFQNSKKNQIRADFKSLVWAATGVAPILAYNAWAYWQDPYLQMWAARNQIRSPNPVHYVLAYGFLLPFAYFGLRSLLRKKWMQGSFLLTWLVLLPFLLYAPIGLQRRLAEGAWVMLVVLTLFPFEGKGARDPRALWLFSLAFPSTLILFIGGLQMARDVDPPVFLPAGEAMAFEELRRVASKGEIVLSSYETGNALPAWAPLRVIAGHGPESVDLERLLLKIQALYQTSTTDVARLRFLRDYGITYVFWGPNEQRLGSWLPADEDYLELVVDLGEYEVYRVSDDAFE
ncbi:MAG TPA: hypothetical protein VI703_06315 [Anaerolineales bacterium]|nr:hypothetical protein [Anaerolineales bacterium]